MRQSFFDLVVGGGRQGGEDESGVFVLPQVLNLEISCPRIMRLRIGHRYQQELEAAYRLCFGWTKNEAHLKE